MGSYFLPFLRVREKNTLFYGEKRYIDRFWSLDSFTFIFTFIFVERRTHYGKKLSTRKRISGSADQYAGDDVPWLHGIQDGPVSRTSRYFDFVRKEVGLLGVQEAQHRQATAEPAVLCRSHEQNVVLEIHMSGEQGGSAA